MDVEVKGSGGDPSRSLQQCFKYPPGLLNFPFSALSPRCGPWHAEQTDLPGRRLQKKNSEQLVLTVGAEPCLLSPSDQQSSLTCPVTVSQPHVGDILLCLKFQS